ncbi:MAG: hypothetical protein ACOYMN_24850 [Roseimicrobium sp.]
MTTHERLAPLLAFSLGALLVVGIGWLAPMPRGTATTVPDQLDSWEIWSLLTQLEKECAPDSPMNDYQWSSNAPPTERHRREMLEIFHTQADVTLTEVHARMEKPRNDEFGEMLVIIAAALGDESMMLKAAHLMAYSEHPAVRLCAARELRKLRDSRTIEWFEYTAQHDDRRVRNDACGGSEEFFYPVRSVSELALKELGVEHPR